MPGRAGSGIGVLGESVAGTGVLASGVTALDVVGPAAFSRSGVLTARAGHSSATKTGVALTSASLVLATLQQHRAGVFVQAAVPDVRHKSLTVHLSKTVPASTKAAWFIANWDECGSDRRRTGKSVYRHDVSYGSGRNTYAHRIRVRNAQD